MTSNLTTALYLSMSDPSLTDGNILVG